MAARGRLLSTLTRITVIGATLALVAMMVHIVLNVVLRVLFDRPVYGTFEIVEYWYLPVNALLGLIAAQLLREHIQVTAFTDLVPEPQRRILHTVAVGVTAALVVLITVGSLRLGIDEAAHQTTAGVTDIPSWPLQLAVPVAFLLFGLLLFAPAVPTDDDELADPAPAGDMLPGVTDHAGSGGSEAAATIPTTPAAHRP